MNETAPPELDTESARRVTVANVILDGRIGGPQRRIIEVADRLKTTGWETLLVFPEMGSDLKRFAADRGVACESLQLSRLRRENFFKSLLVLFVRFPLEVARLVAIYRRHNVGLVHVNGVLTVQAIVSARIAGLPVVWHFNDMALPRGACRLWRFLFAPLVRVLVYSSERVREHYGGKTKRPETILYPPIDMQRFDPALSGEAIPDELRLLRPRKDETILLSVGNINPLKGYEFLIDALRRLSGHCDPWRLVVIGMPLSTNKNYYSTLTRKLAENGLMDKVAFIGSTSHLVAAFAAADFVVVSSISESGPMVLTEALAMGKPVVSTDVGFAREVIRDGKNGFLVPAQNSRALCTAIERLLIDRKLRERLASAARESVPQAVRIDSVVEETRQVYRLAKFGRRAP